MFEGDSAAAKGLAGMLAVLAREQPPGPAAVATLAAIDPASLPGAAQVDLLTAWERQAAWVDAQQVQVLAAMDHPADTAPPGGVDAQGCPELVAVPGDEEWTALEVAAALRLSPLAAHRRLDVARELTRRLPGTLRALAAGQVSYYQALTITDTTTALTGAQATEVETRVLPTATTQSVGRLRRALARAVIAADPAGAQARHETAAAQRTVDYWALPDGIALLRMIGPAADVAATHTALTALADRPHPTDDQRPIGARRFDALHQICTDILTGQDSPADQTGPGGAGDNGPIGRAGRAGGSGGSGDPVGGPDGAGSGCGGGPLPIRHGHRPHIAVTVAASTLLGLDQQPGELAGYGPITAEVARRIAAGGTWRRILHDPADGTLLHYGRTIYRPPADLTRHIIARDRTCTFPHCAQPAQRCDIDHAFPFDAGGTTDPDNCGALCRRHHRAKTIGGWTLQRNPDHTCTWTSPTGHTYTVHPPPIGGS